MGNGRGREMAGENLDLSSDGILDHLLESSARERRFLGIRFVCCEVYARIYINRDESAYEGHCPRCSKPVRLAIGPGGTDCRFFTVY